MCGIVGLHLRNPQLYPRLGELLTGMLIEMEDRGADSAGVAVYGDPTWSPSGQATVSVLGYDGEPGQLAEALEAALGVSVTARDVGGTLLVNAPLEAHDLQRAVEGAAPQALIIGFGEDLAVLKGVGRPRDLAASYRLADAQGWQGVGHTRMATESAVTPAGSHPYAVGPDQCLVHNGSFHNYPTIRRELLAKGITFDSANDTEVGARFVADRLADGAAIDAALTTLCERFDGFYTLLVSNRDSFAVVRDAIACKPAVIAEHPDWVAMASEYRALVGLPGIDEATLWEPEPEVVYAWTR